MTIQDFGEYKAKARGTNVFSLGEWRPFSAMVPSHFQAARQMWIRSEERRAWPALELVSTEKKRELKFWSTHRMSRLLSLLETEEQRRE